MPNAIKNCLYTILLSYSILGLVRCKSADDKTDHQPDSTALAAPDSTIGVIDVDSSDSAFSIVLDSVYQRSAKKAFQALMIGHQRFSKDSPFVYKAEVEVPDSLARIKPFLVVADIDLNESVEKIFDLKRSMFIQLSSPACLVDPKQIAVMEYALNYSQTKVILVLSSSGSRIIGAAVDNVQTPNFGSIVNELSPATKSAQEFADRSSANKSFVNNIAQVQARYSIDRILQNSPQVKMLADSGKVVLKSAFYDSGKRTLTILDQGPSLNPSAKK